MKCYFCQTEYSFKYFNSEHIIPQALGGNLESRKIICSGCNERYGRTIDIELINNFRLISSTLNVFRARRSNKSIYIKDHNGVEAFRFDPEKGIRRKSKIEKIDENRYIIYGTNSKEIEEESIKLSKRLGRKIKTPPNENFEPTFDREINFSWEFNSGSIEVLRSLYKSALLYYLYKNHNPDLLGRKFAFCDGNSAGNLICPYSETTKILPNFSETEIYHSIILTFSNNLKGVYALITLFSTFSYLAQIAFNYSGESYSQAYKQNVITGKIDDLNIYWEPKQNFKTSSDQNKFIIESHKPLNYLIYKKVTASSLGHPLVSDYFGIKKGTIIEDKHIDIFFNEKYKLLDYGFTKVNINGG
ncbi:HNH endonuclease [Leptospira sp. 2 VSF19]|uniref:HNH endonuclease n=1 Tax=Leptospira soteropolitanensis TaxID=2950025 RepID=A0AAW5VHW1_9LEPT|nr:HNH endonuclease [Leptospira soteropolitanensis]MCW7494730.1 HNH endonuclease [Leptospira soteropolitanensis]MCW7502331.1 HNH endonuclease [Leptospira soteropolitanensis]MCW7524564.1 HNH endonuclease [Leptospira soteropolitanensis]MCW7528429.1 HNH endonuclease [Leptospira soteropolitanensis]MCW7532293.1 HNH endonuclease [Leptospira soteropolitanensis]